MRHGRNACLVRGSVRPDQVFANGSKHLIAARLAWDSLHENGHFKSGRADRVDLTRYLAESLPQINAQSFSSYVTRMLDTRVLATLPPGF